MNTQLNNNINFYLLAGGKSSRMGTDKGLLTMHGKCLIEFTIEQLKPIAKNIFIVTDNKTYSKFNLEIIGDEIQGIGPAGGIYSSLKHSDTELNFITSCDMPFITTEAIIYLISKTANYEITLPYFNKQVEPLFGVYSKKITKDWLQLIQQGNYKLHELVNHFNVQKINVASHPLFSKKLFMNINTPGDLKQAMQL